MNETVEAAKLNEEGLAKILKFIGERRGIDLCSYRKNFVFRHLRGRLLETEANSPLAYISYIKANPAEIDEFLNALSINVTHFFRDAEVFEVFRKKVIPEIIKRKESTEQKLIRIWSAGCASGQEPYSIAILLKEALAARDDYLIRIWATDVDSEALERARLAQYEERDLREVDKKMREKYFQCLPEGKYNLKEEIKRMVRFEKHNLITDAGMKFMDVIFCRNVMIYFTRQQQDLLFNKFHESLNCRGYLVIAKVEAIWNKDIFEAVDNIQKIYQKVKE
jgi:chemotaxis methyl-accepting protein methylase